MKMNCKSFYTDGGPRSENRLPVKEGIASILLNLYPIS